MFDVLEKTIEILAIFNKYKNIVENLVNNLGIKLSIKSRLISQGPRNIMTNLEDPLIMPRLDKYFLDRLLL